MTTFMPSFGPWHQNVAEVTRKGPVAMVRDPSILPAAKKNTHCIKHIDSHVEYIYIYIHLILLYIYTYALTCGQLDVHVYIYIILYLYNTSPWIHLGLTFSLSIWIYKGPKV